MALTNKQKKWIDKNHSKFSPDKMAVELNLNREEVEAYVATFNHKPPTKLFYLILILIPVVFFVALEIGLRLFDYGYDFTQWVNVTKDKLVLNTDIAHKYFFNTINVPYSNQNAFDEVKTDSTFRVFVLGGSSAAGFPFLPLGSFSSYLQDRLSLTYPNSKIEVINCSMSAINSYTIRDIMPGVIEQKPDLIIIYAGHNEYYGALGVGSMENLGTSREIVNFVISLEKFKTFQLIRDALKYTMGLLTNKKQLSGTLMSRMAQNQFIEYNSDIYNKGLLQFEENMEDILEMAKGINVPVILGSLTCNLKDQKPFVSITKSKYPSANEIYQLAQSEFESSNYKTADSLFRFARDLDALRFRAPGKINDIIYKLGNNFNYPVVNIDSVFQYNSPENIVGNNLMTDHLHPTILGYQIMGKAYYEEMEKFNCLPQTKPNTFTNVQADSITKANFHFSKLDSIIGEYRIKLLKNDWPFIEKVKKQPDYVILQPKDHVDSLAVRFLVEDPNWEKIHRELADWYLKKKDINSFLDVMNVLITQYPIILSYYDYVANELMNLQMFDKAYIYLNMKNGIRPDAFSTKWLGIIELSRNNNEKAKTYLLESLKYSENDAQVWYNLAGCYTIEEDYKNALESVNRSLKIEPGYIEAKNLKMQLESALKN